MIDNAGYGAEVGMMGAYFFYEQFLQDDTNPDAVGPPSLVGSFVPVYGSGRTAINAWENGRYGSAAVNGVFTVLDLAIVPGLVRGVVQKGLRGAGRAA